MEGGYRGVVANVLNFNIVVGEFEPQPRYYVHLYPWERYDLHLSLQQYVK